MAFDAYVWIKKRVCFQTILLMHLLNKTFLLGWLLFFYGTFSCVAQDNKAVLRQKKHAASTTIYRDQWGIPHVFGKTDADAVFGLMYAQCEDDFARVEQNYINVLGRNAELKGHESVFEDLYTRMVLDSSAAVEDYTKAPEWFKKLLMAWSDGIHFYLTNHPEVQPKLLKEFKPWYPLLWTDGSISAISTGHLTYRDVENFYLRKPANLAAEITEKEPIPTGSNGFAIAPPLTSNGHALLYINPHTTFYFRPEVHMVSEEGLNAYGAVTWGQFFIYQGFNEHCGWMHTSSNADVSDVYRETVEKKGDQLKVMYDGQWFPMRSQMFSIGCKLANGQIGVNAFEAYFTHHGPILGWEDEAHWLSVQHQNRSLNGLIQSWQRTKAKGLDDFKRTLALRTNTSNNTVYADNKGNIGYWHGNFMPIRNTKYDWAKTVDGTTAETGWKGLHQLEEIVHQINPKGGWLQNCNSTPFTMSGINSPQSKNYPAYMAPDGENFRGIQAVRLLSSVKNYTLDSLIKIGYSTYLPAFEVLVPALLRARLYCPDSLKSTLKAPLDELATWNFRSSVQSVATTLAIEWAQFHLSKAIQQVYIVQGEKDQVSKTKQFAATASSDELLSSFAASISRMQLNYGTWQIPWGNINRFQRLSGSQEGYFNDDSASIAVGFASSLWGALPSFNSLSMQGSTKRYGYNGNSFVCAVEFGSKIKAKSLLAGGNSGHPNSSHFADQANMYANGQFKEVLFYKQDIQKNAVHIYHPGTFD